MQLSLFRFIIIIINIFIPIIIIIIITLSCTYIIKISIIIIIKNIKSIITILLIIIINIIVIILSFAGLTDPLASLTCQVIGSIRLRNNSCLLVSNSLQDSVTRPHWMLLLLLIASDINTFGTPISPVWSL